MPPFSRYKRIAPCFVCAIKRLQPSEYILVAFQLMVFVIPILIGVTILGEAAPAA